ncbi:MAG: hypothetical protein ACYTG5_05315, partial [Planctomycetota bacterium]
MLGLPCVPLSALILLYLPILLGDALDSLRAADDDPAAWDSLQADCLLFAGLALAAAILSFTS